MPKRPQALAELPAAVQAGLRTLGADLALARKRRKQSLKDWAQRIGISEPTLMRMEKGDPGVAMGIYATALWLVGRSAAVADLAAPQHDMGALEQDLRVAQARGARRPVSLSARLHQGVVASRSDAPSAVPSVPTPKAAARKTAASAEPELSATPVRRRRPT